MMSYKRCVLTLMLVLASLGCIKPGGDDNEAVTTLTTSIMQKTTTSLTVMTSILRTVPWATTTVTTTTVRVETTYTTIQTGTCYDRIRNQGEAGVDCGGPCPPCEIECTKDGDCGNQHYSKQYCKEEGGRWYIMRDNITYVCRDPGEWNASCILVKTPEKLERCPAHKQCVFTDFCPGSTYKKCEEARCILKEDVCKWIFC